MGYLASYGGLGDDASGMTPVEALAAQVNRFGPTAPAAHRIVPNYVPVTGQAVTMELAIPAIVVAHRRANEAYLRFGDAGSLQAVEDISAGYANPVGFVTNRIAELTQTLRAYGDSLGLLPASSVSGGGIPSGYLWIAAAALVAYLLTRKGGAS